MIKTSEGSTQLKGTEAMLIADYMCITKSIILDIILPKQGKEHLEEELSKVISEVIRNVREESEDK